MAFKPSLPPAPCETSAIDRALFLGVGATRPNAVAKALEGGASIHARIPASGRGSRDHRDSPGARPIARAALGHPLDFKRWPDLIEMLLKAGADPNERAVSEQFVGRPTSWTPLHGVLGKFHHDPQATMKAARALVAFGADPNARLEQPDGQPSVGLGLTPLMCVCHASAWEMALWLLSLPGIDPKAVDDQGQNAFHWAAQGGAIPGHEPVFERLLALGVAVDEPDANGFTPLMHEIADPRRYKMDTRSRLDWFLSHGSDPTRVSPSGSLSLANWARRERPFAILERDCWKKLESAALSWEINQVASATTDAAILPHGRRIAL
jgi:hypothetical protein